MSPAADRWAILQAAARPENMNDTAEIITRRSSVLRARGWFFGYSGSMAPTAVTEPKFTCRNSSPPS